MEFGFQVIQVAPIRVWYQVLGAFLRTVKPPPPPWYAQICL